MGSETPKGADSHDDGTDEEKSVYDMGDEERAEFIGEKLEGIDARKLKRALEGRAGKAYSVFTDGDQIGGGFRK